MSKKTLYLLGILVTIFIGTWLNTIFCCNSSATVNANLPLKNSQSLQKKPTIKITKSNFNFKKTTFTSLLPVSDSLNGLTQQLKKDLDKSPNSKFTITGFYSSKEGNSSIFENLGLARAHNVKNYFLSKGFSTKQIQIFGALKENLSIQNDTVFGPITISAPQVQENENNKTNWSLIKANANATPLTLYFKKNEASISLSPSDRNKINTLLSYLENVPNSKIIITGHTDTSGKRENNAYYSIERAKFVKKYFVANGISENKIVTFGKGSSKPIADNATETGRSKNRRAELTLQ